MGVIRVLLALSVVLSHGGDFWGVRLIPGATAVQTFFIISGFYMGLILNEKYRRPDEWGLFLSNRFLRIFPIYWLALTIHLCVGYGAGLHLTDAEALAPVKFAEPFRHWYALGLDVSSALTALLAVPQAVIFGLTSLPFLGVRDAGAFALILDYRADPLPGVAFTFLPQAWSLDTELVFYLLAPLIARRSPRVLVVLLAALLGLKLGAAQWLVANRPGVLDAVQYHFIPLQLVFFVLGVGLYRLYARIEHRLPPALGWSAVAVIAAFSLSFWDLPLPDGVKSKLYYVAIAISLPAIFAATRRCRWDSWIGELSYPIYVLHVTVIMVLSLNGLAGQSLAVGSVIGSLAGAVVLTLAVSHPIELWRQRRVLAAKAAAT